MKPIEERITYNIYKFIEDYKILKYILGFITFIILFSCFITILFNSFKGVSYILNEFFALDSYKYINRLNINLQDNFSKLYLPEFIISCCGLISLIFILIYVISYDKYNKSLLE